MPIIYNQYLQQYGYDPLLEIYMFSTSIKLKCFLTDIQHCVTVVGKWIFDHNINFELPLTREYMDSCCTNED